MSKPRVLLVCHAHPAWSAGGTEIYTQELYQEIRRQNDFEPFLICRAQDHARGAGSPHDGRRGAGIGGDPNQFAFFVDESEWDPFLDVIRDKEHVVPLWTQLVQAIRPDVVHFQHTLLLGFDLLRATRSLLPAAPILYTLHEFVPICLHDGKMVRTAGNDLCESASPADCARCFPECSPADFFRRRCFIQSHFGVVDRFLAPSHFLRERFVAWGIPAARISYEDNGRRALPAAEVPARPGPRNRFGFFGNLADPFKGLDVLLHGLEAIAAKPLQGTAIEVSVHGAGVDRQPWLREALERFPQNSHCRLRFAGPYTPTQQPALMAEVDWVVVPSIWWENAPLVIQEAFAAGRPVIASDIGGMAEKVTHGKNGLHFRVRDPLSLADSFRKAAGTPGLWEQLVEGIPAVYSIKVAAPRMAALYRELLNSRDRGAR